MKNREIANREQRLRRAAAKKGLYIKKRKWRIYYDSHDVYSEYQGYCVGIQQTGLIVWGGNSNGLFLPTLEEAEEIVENYGNP